MRRINAAILCVVAVMVFATGLGAKADGTYTPNAKYDFGKYWIQNNTFPSHPISGWWQGIWQTYYNNPDSDMGWQWHWPTGNGGEVKAYPYIGNFWGLGMPLSANKNILMDWDIKLTNTSGIFNCAWDFWLNADGQLGSDATDEIMIWMYTNNSSSYPAGSYQGTVTIAGASWEVWKGTITSSSKTWNYFAFKRTSNVTSVRNLNAKDFTDYLVRRAWLSPNKYLSQIHAGSEIVEGDGTISTTRYRVDVQ